ncbi:MAG: type II toxin-antitoxin system RelE family toxin [Acidithiobacillus ferrivorans]
MRRLELTRDVLKFLYGLPSKQFKQVAATMLDLLRDPEPHDSRLLPGCAYRRVDIGEYRIVYALLEDMVRVLLIGKRNVSNGMDVSTL